MKVIFALGNPTDQYRTTRHNAGWLLLDAYAEKQAGRWEHKTKFLAEIMQFSHHGEPVLLVKPQTFYNETGKSARAIADFYHLQPDDFCIMHDDLALPLGRVRIRHGGSDAGNNGIKSLNQHLGEKTWRVRVGIQNTLRPPQMSDANFVLQSFAAEEQELLRRSIYPIVAEYITNFLDGTIAPTSHSLAKNLDK